MHEVGVEIGIERRVVGCSCLHAGRGIAGGVGKGGMRTAGTRRRRWRRSGVDVLLWLGVWVDTGVRGLALPGLEERRRRRRRTAARGRAHRLGAVAVGIGARRGVALGGGVLVRFAASRAAGAAAAGRREGSDVVIGGRGRGEGRGG